MKSIFKILSLISALSFLSTASFALSLGDRLESISGVNVKMRNAGDATKDSKKAQLSIQEIRGKKGTLIIFSCNHCPYVKAWKARMLDLGKLALSKDIGVAMINSNDPSEDDEDDYATMVKEAKGKWGFAYLEDTTSDMARSFEAKRTPEVFLFDAAGKLAYHGAVDSDAQAKDKAAQSKPDFKPYLKTAIEEVSEGKKVSVAETKSVGCGIRFRDKK